jgi:hypothetical protein
MTMPRVVGEWQCREGVSIVFPDKERYAVMTSAGERVGAYKIKLGENNAHFIKWTPDVSGESAPLPDKFRYYETERFARLFFYSVEGQDVTCERYLKKSKT